MVRQRNNFLKHSNSFVFASREELTRCKAWGKDFTLELSLSRGGKMRDDSKETHIPWIHLLKTVEHQFAYKFDDKEAVFTAHEAWNEVEVQIREKPI